MFDWITGVIDRTGYAGVFLLMLVENIFPPIPSELIMPLAGFTAAQGTLDPVLVVLAGTAGSLLGALFWYYAGTLAGPGAPETLRGAAWPLADPCAQRGRRGQ